MKKTVIIILILLPIVLLISIAIAGRFRSKFQTVFVEKVDFIDEDFGSVYEYDDIFELTVGESKPTKIRFTPKDADNQNVTYTSSQESVCTVDKDGVLYGVSGGKATITVTTEDGNKQAFLQVFVNADKVTGIFLPYQDLTLSLGDSFKLMPTVMLPEALDKTVHYESSNENVCKVDANGNLFTRATGSTTITVTTNDGGFTATCEVTVTSGTPTLKFDFTNAEFINFVNGVCVTTQATVDLKEYLIINTEVIDANDIVFRIESGGKNCTLKDGVLTLLNKGVVHVKAYVSNTIALAYQTEIKISLSIQ
ncbi:MAG: Ig domain-containing protein [Clostridia bacterium]|nr:Ig domain-containing protein [Clostridia bacterium]